MGLRDFRISFLSSICGWMVTVPLAALTILPAQQQILSQEGFFHAKLIKARVIL